MKRIRNRKYLKARRMQYSILLGAYRSSIQEYFQTASELKDEAEFEARVAAKLAETWGGAPSAEAMTEAYIHGKSIAWALLKIARLQVEEEMDADQERTGMAGEPQTRRLVRNA